MCMRLLWPIAAAACSSDMVRGLLVRPNLSIPAAMAPEETMTISIPCCLSSDSSPARREMNALFRPAPKETRSLLPTLITTRRTPSMISFLSCCSSMGSTPHLFPTPTYLPYKIIHALTGPGGDREEVHPPLAEGIPDPRNPLPYRGQVYLVQDGHLRFLHECGMELSQFLVDLFIGKPRIPLGIGGDVHKVDKEGGPLDMAKKPTP